MAEIKVGQIVAVEKGVKSRAYADFTAIHHQLSKPPLLAGIARTYQPKDDDGERFPPESTRVQLRADFALKQVAATLGRLFDVVATKDYGNTQARADVVVDGEILVSQAPVPFLLFLEKQLTDLMTFVAKLPVLDPSETWHWDAASDSYATEATQTTKTKKVPRNHVKAEATKEHPAQVEMFFEDVLVGYWTTVKFSGALPQSRVTDLFDRVVKLSEAVKIARETANGVKVPDVKTGEAIFGYLFG